LFSRSTAATLPLMVHDTQYARLPSFDITKVFQSSASSSLLEEVPAAKGLNGMLPRYESSSHENFCITLLFRNTTYRYLPSGETLTWCGDSITPFFVPTSMYRMSKPEAASITVTTSQP